MSTLCEDAESVHLVAFAVAFVNCVQSDCQAALGALLASTCTPQRAGPHKAALTVLLLRFTHSSLSSLTACSMLAIMLRVGRLSGKQPAGGATPPPVWCHLLLPTSMMMFPKSSPLQYPRLLVSTKEGLAVTQRQHNNRQSGPPALLAP